MPEGLLRDRNWRPRRKVLRIHAGSIILRRKGGRKHVERPVFVSPGHAKSNFFQRQIMHGAWVRGTFPQSWRAGVSRGLWRHVVQKSAPHPRREHESAEKQPHKRSGSGASWRSFAALGAPWPPQWAQEIMHATWVRSTILQKGRYGAQRGGAILQK